MTDARNAERAILVSGATGQQGGAVARALIGKSFRVRALTRNTEKPEARSLAESGADMYEWFNEEGYEADIPALRKVRPELISLEQYLRGHGWENI